MTVRGDPDRETTERLERRALEKMLFAVSRHALELAREAECRGALTSREGLLQVQALFERREQAARLLEDPTIDSHGIRVTRLERLIEALESSRAYFRTASGIGSP